jgi:alpha-methylacyl-CoA racemase
VSAPDLAGALDGVLVLDFSAYLPGPLATLMLAQAGAEVIKIERPEGEPGRADPVIFNLINRGKRSITIDLKRECGRLRPLLERADVVVEQFRPGVMDRLGLGYEHVRAVNPGVIYVSINGYGSSGPDALRPGHDLTYQAESGLLSLNVDARGDPVLPAAMAADIGGGSQSAFANIALALYRRSRTGEGARIEVPMFNGMLAFLNEPIAHAAAGRDIHPGYSPATGSSARYNLYRAADGRWLALASPEEKFWQTFCNTVQLPTGADRAAVAARLAERPAADWLALFEGADLCCSLVATVEEALTSPRIQRLLENDPLPLPVSTQLARSGDLAQAPELGEAEAWLDSIQAS